MFGNAQFHNTQWPSFPWDKCKNPYPLRNCITCNEATARAPGTTRSVVSWCLGSKSHVVGNYVISEWVWVLAINHVHIWTRHWYLLYHRKAAGLGTISSGWPGHVYQYTFSFTSKSFSHWWLNLTHIFREKEQGWLLGVGQAHSTLWCAVLTEMPIILSNITIDYETDRYKLR